jgi:hypothetical protein
MTIKTIGFLPQIFQTQANQKFLNATLDQLVTQPNFKKVNGYIGRTFAPTFKIGDNYVSESTSERQNYQLEACVVSTDANGNNQFFSHYSDLLQQIGYYGGITGNQSRLFGQESYSFDGQFDFDKLVNFSQYYWLNNGPLPVQVFTGNAPTSNSYTVKRDAKLSAYTFNTEITQNPEIILARGGTYTFEINQPGFPFWIQTLPTLTGTTENQPTINLRNVLGVTNNGTDFGTITFTVPQLDAQDTYINMPLAATVDLATTLPFDQIDNQVITNLHNGIDGLTNLAGKTLIFVNNDPSDPNWTEQGVYANNNFGEVYDPGTVVPNNQRYGIWQCQVDIIDGAQVLNLVYIQDVAPASKVFIKSGETKANFEYYLDNTNRWQLIPLTTTILDTLYYNDGINELFSGKLRIVDGSNFTIHIDTEILGKKNYTSPNGVVFTNGLKVEFGLDSLPVEYQNKQYYVEGVGTAIRLVAVTSLITPELDQGSTTIPFDVYSFDMTTFDEPYGGPIVPDYITINRSSVDGNAWSRSNRWFHSDVIVATAKYNEIPAQLDQSMRATRPIIEFNPDLQLVNHGSIYHPGVDIIDFTIRDAMETIEGLDPTIAASYFNYALLKDGMTIVFANDYDPLVRTQIFKINVIDIPTSQYSDGTGTIQTEPAAKFIHLTEVDGGKILPSDVIIPLNGTTVLLSPPVDPAYASNSLYRTIDPSMGIGKPAINNVLYTAPPYTHDIGTVLGLSYWFNGSKWIASQAKQSINTSPLFDIFDINSNSLSNETFYYNSSFNGTKLFSYKVGTGTKDAILGFPLTYRNIDNMGDIEFENNYDLDTFDILEGKKTLTYPVSSGFIGKIVGRSQIEQVNVWAKLATPSRQYQIISAKFNGVSPYFNIDILPDQTLLVPNMNVFVNSKLIPTSSWAIVNSGVANWVHIVPALVKGDQIDIQIFNATETSGLGHYQVPSNLDSNPMNETFTQLTLGQFRNHLVAMTESSTEVVGIVPGSSNLRDLNIKTRGGNILQHSAPLIYSEMFLLNKDLNFMDANAFAQKEYARFKNRFLELSGSVINAGITDTVAGVDYIM